MEQYRIKSPDGLELCCYQSSVSDSTKIAVYVHGYAEHLERPKFDILAKMFNEKKIDFFSLDQRGHGKSDGVRGYTDSFLRYREDLNIFLSELKKKNKPIVMIGHSMGGLIALDYITSPYKNDINCSVIMSPLLKLNVKNDLKELFGKLLRKVKPTLLLPTEIKPEWITHDKDEVFKYANDPLIFKTFSVSWYFESLKWMERVNKLSSEIAHPVLFFHGTADKLCDFATTRKFYESTSFSKKKFIAKEDKYHELLNETDWKVTVDEILKWIIEN